MKVFLTLFLICAQILFLYSLIVAYLIFFFRFIETIFIPYGYSFIVWIYSFRLRNLRLYLFIERVRFIFRILFCYNIETIATNGERIVVVYLRRA
jgi:hypothetical protein